MNDIFLIYEETSILCLMVPVWRSSHLGENPIDLDTVGNQEITPLNS